MHTLVSPVLLRRGGFDEVGQDAESDPPDRELRESSEGERRGERHAVVGSDALGESELLKGAREDPLGV
jgi:hypothetical protein